MAAITICSDFGAQKNKVCHCFPIYFPPRQNTKFIDIHLPLQFLITEPHKQKSLSSQTWVGSPAEQQSQFTDTTLLWSKAQHFLQGPAMRTDSSGLEDLNSLMAFREGFFKAIICNEGCRIHDFLLTGWWWGNSFRKLHHQLSSSNQSGVYKLVLSK